MKEEKNPHEEINPIFPIALVALIGIAVLVFGLKLLGLI